MDGLGIEECSIPLSTSSHHHLHIIYEGTTHLPLPPFTSQIKIVSRYKAVQANQTSHAIQNGRSREQTHLLTIFNCGHPGDPEATSWKESAIRLRHHHHHLPCGHPGHPDKPPHHHLQPNKSSSSIAPLLHHDLAYRFQK